MTCLEAAPLISGLLDHELTEDENGSLRQHLDQCPTCTDEVASLQRVRETLGQVRLWEPPPEAWDKLRLEVYHRVERATGWVLVSAGMVALIAYGAWHLATTVLVDPVIPLAVRWGIGLVSSGLVVLGASALRNRIIIARQERYGRVIR